jgi:integrase
MFGEDEQAVDSNDIKEILHHCDNRRLKAYLLVLASGGMRAMEALAIRECDVDFSCINFSDPNYTSQPATVHIRKEYSKTKRERNIFISNEAARYLHDWIEWIYRDKSLERKGGTALVNRVRTPDDLIFSRKFYNGTYPTGLYSRLLIGFQKVLERAHLASRKEDGVYKRRNITFHSFRRFVTDAIGSLTDKVMQLVSEVEQLKKKSEYIRNKQQQQQRQ